MALATVEDAIAYTPEAEGESELRLRGVLEDAAREVEKVAPPRPPAESLLSDDISATAQSLKIGPVRSVPGLSAHLLYISAESYPQSGVLRIGDEDISYEYRDSATQTFLELTRGYGRSGDKRTTAAIHLAGDRVLDVGYEYAFFYTQLKVFDYFWKTGGGITNQYTNQAVGASASFLTLGSIRAMIRTSMGGYAVGAAPAPIVRG